MWSVDWFVATIPRVPSALIPAATTGAGTVVPRPVAAPDASEYAATEPSLPPAMPKSRFAPTATCPVPAFVTVGSGVVFGAPPASDVVSYAR